MERRELILSAVQDRGTVRTRDIAAELGVSEVTIRNDFEALELQGRVSRVHGGVTLCDTSLVGFDARSRLNVDAKHRIGAAAAQLVSDRSTIILDSGTTVFELARNLPTFKDLVVLTPGIRTALSLADVDGVSTRLLGGLVDARIYATVGSARQQGLEGEIANVVFFGAGAIDEENDIVEGSLNIVESKKNMVRAARKRVLLADSSKWHSFDRHKVMRVYDFDVVVTDSGISDTVRESITAKGVELIVV